MRRLAVAALLLAGGAHAEEPASAPPEKVQELLVVERPARHIDLDSTAITGNQELPKVMVIVPWKKAELGPPGGRPVASLVEEALEPVDRDVFRRHLEYYDVLYGKDESERTD